MRLDLDALVKRVQANFDALSPSQKLRHRYMQKRSFARGMCSRSTPYDVHCANVDHLMPDEAVLTDTQIGLILVGEKYE